MLVHVFLSSAFELAHAGDGMNNEVCDAWPVRCQTYGYLPSFAASPTFTAWWQRQVCVSGLLVYSTAQWVRLESATSRSRVRRFTTGCWYIWYLDIAIITQEAMWCLCKSCTLSLCVYSLARNYQQNSTGLYSITWNNWCHVPYVTIPSML